MVIRIFNCGVCRHKMRVGQSRCGYCHSKRPLHRTLWPYGTLAVIALVIAITNLLSVPGPDAALDAPAASVFASADQ